MKNRYGWSFEAFLTIVAKVDGVNPATGTLTCGDVIVRSPCPLSENSSSLVLVPSGEERMLPPPAAGDFCTTVRRSQREGSGVTQPFAGHSTLRRFHTRPYVLVPQSLLILDVPMLLPHRTSGTRVLRRWKYKHEVASIASYNPHFTRPTSILQAVNRRPRYSWDIKEFGVGEHRPLKYSTSGVSYRNLCKSTFNERTFAGYSKLVFLVSSHGFTSPR